MRRFLAILLLAVLPSIGLADQVMLFGPDGVQLPPGNYRLLSIPADATQPPASTVLAIGGQVAPSPVVPTPVPPINDVATKVSALIATVTADVEKAKTAKGISEGYKLILGLVENGTFSNPDHVRQAAKIGIDMGLSQVGKSTAWKPFTDGMESLTAPMDLTELTDCYVIASAKLVDPPNPPTPNPSPNPSPKVTAVVYVYEKDQSAIPPPVAGALQQINAAGSGVVATEFEEDTTDGDGEVPDQYRATLIAARTEGLPALVVMSGENVLRVVKNPQTEQDVMGAIK